MKSYMGNPNNYGPEYDAYLMRSVAEELEQTDVLPTEAIVEIMKTQATISRILAKLRQAA